MAKLTGLKKKLADAHQRNRDLDNEKHALEIEVDRLRQALVDCAAENEAIGAELRTRPPRAERSLTDIELSALSGFALLEAMPKTPLRESVAEAILREMEHRGVIEVAVPYVNDAMDAREAA